MFAKRIAYALVLPLALTGFLVTAPATAEICTIDAVPAATLLLPYFEVDLANQWGIDTFFEINNATAAEVLAHVTVWSDFSVPVLDFNVYLTGYDILAISLRDVLQGNLPQTAPGDPALSPTGLFSTANPGLDLGSCADQLPLPPLSIFPGLVESIQASLKGESASHLGGLCAGFPWGDDLARGYVTVDAVRSCSLEFPGDPGYFVSGGQGTATNDNVLWGNAYHLIDGEEWAQGTPLVHIEADGMNPETSVPGEYTFYGRYTSWTAADNREPLATRFGARYVNGGAFSGGTDLMVWRDSKLEQGPLPCGTDPAWFPLSQEALVIFDEAETPVVPQVFPVSPQPPQTGLLPFPLETQRVSVGGPTLPVPFNAGWLFLSLNTFVTPAGGVPPEDPNAAQGWVQVAMTAEGMFSVGFEAMQLDSACAASTIIPAPP